MILDTCGQYFTSGSTKKKLDYYLLYFQRYYLFKKSCYPSTESFPLGMSQLFMDTVTGLKPKLEMYEDFEAACEAVLKVRLTLEDISSNSPHFILPFQVEEEFIAVLKEKVPNLMQTDTENMEHDNSGLGTIR